MGFLDPQMVNMPLPDNWNEYDLHVEISVGRKEAIRFLEETGWECFSEGEIVASAHTGVDRYATTKWYGKKI